MCRGVTCPTLHLQRSHEGDRRTSIAADMKPRASVPSLDLVLVQICQPILGRMNSWTNDGDA